MRLIHAHKWWTNMHIMGVDRLNKLTFYLFTYLHISPDTVSGWGCVWRSCLRSIKHFPRTHFRFSKQTGTHAGVKRGGSHVRWTRRLQLRRCQFSRAACFIVLVAFLSPNCMCPRDHDCTTSLLCVVAENKSEKRWKYKWTKGTKHENTSFDKFSLTWSIGARMQLTPTLLLRKYFMWVLIKINKEITCLST